MSYVSKLRAILGPAADALQHQRGRGYRLVRTDGTELAIDELECRRLVASGADSDLAQAWSLWRGPEPYPELDGDDPVPGLLGELRELRAECRRRLAESLIVTDRADEAVRLLDRALVESPYDQLAASKLMRAHAASGRPQLATRVYSELVGRLREDFGDPPLVQLIELDGRIVQGDPDLVRLGPQAHREAIVPGGNAGVPVDSTRFIGRRMVLETVCDALRSARLVVITGLGGSGKSRLAREASRVCGIAEQRFVQFADCAEDGNEVRARFAKSLGAPISHLPAMGGEPLLVVVDNCEHVIDHVALAISELIESTGSVVVVATSRLPLHLPGELEVAFFEAFRRRRAESCSPTASRVSEVMRG